MPPSASPGEYATGIQFRSHRRCAALRPNVCQHLGKIGRVRIGIGPDGCPERRTALAGPPESRCPVGVAQLHPAGLGCLQCLLGTPGDGFALLLGDQRHDADGQVVGVRHVAGKEADAGVPKREQEGSIAGKPIEFGDDQRGAGELRELERLQ